uniref:Uncharacterized protein n=1 Tax=Geospiza parvula TaxID=87175 RepID=A0A8C3N742_GEOPR
APMECQTRALGASLALLCCCKDHLYREVQGISNHKIIESKTAASSGNKEESLICGGRKKDPLCVLITFGYVQTLLAFHGEGVFCYPKLQHYPWSKILGKACNIILGARFWERSALQCIDIFPCLCKQGAFQVTQVLQCNNKVKLEKKKLYTLNN